MSLNQTLNHAPRHASTALAPGLCALFLLCACAGQPGPGQGAELERETVALRARVERLERESSTERARLAADIAAMREDMRALRTTLEEALRARVERLERESSTERARLAADIAAMREDMRALRTTLEETSRTLAASSGPSGTGPSGLGLEGGLQPVPPGQSGKSPRQALRDSLRNMLEVSREALERLNLELARQLAQPQKQDRPER